MTDTQNNNGVAHFKEGINYQDIKEKYKNSRKVSGLTESNVYERVVIRNHRTVSGNGLDTKDSSSDRNGDLDKRPKFNSFDSEEIPSKTKFAFSKRGSVVVESDSEYESSSEEYEKITHRRVHRFKPPKDDANKKSKENKKNAIAVEDSDATTIGNSQIDDEQSISRPNDLIQPTHQRKVHSVPFRNDANDKSDIVHSITVNGHTNDAKDKSEIVHSITVNGHEINEDSTNRTEYSDIDDLGTYKRITFKRPALHSSTKTTEPTENEDEVVASITNVLNSQPPKQDTLIESNSDNNIELIYAKPPRLRRDMITDVSTDDIKQDNDKQLPVHKQSVSFTGLPETRHSCVIDDFEEHNQYVNRVVLCLIDYSVIPGGALRGIIKLNVEKEVRLYNVTVAVEMNTKLVSASEKHDMDLRVPISHVVLTDDMTVDGRLYSDDISYDSPEFAASPLKVVNVDDAAFLPYIGPWDLDPGNHAIPFAFPISLKAHPSILMKGKVGLSGEIEIVHKYNISATLKMSDSNQSSEPFEINTKELNFKVISCGPPERLLPNGNLVPAVMQTYEVENKLILIQLDKVVLQEMDTINIHLFTDDPTGIKDAEAYLLRIFHIPAINVNDTKALYKLRKYPPNVFVDSQSDIVKFVSNFPMPYSPDAEIMSTSQSDESQHTAHHPLDFRVSTESLSGSHMLNRQRSSQLHRTLPRVARKAGCHLVLNVPNNSVPQTCLDNLKITYYVRILIRIKRKVIAYSLPVTVVEELVDGYQIHYLDNVNYLHDPEYMKLKRDNRCSVS